MNARDIIKLAAKLYDRDTNASINILKKGLQMQSA